MKRTFYVFWGRVDGLIRPVVLDIMETSHFSSLSSPESYAAAMKPNYPFPSDVTYTEIDLDDFIPMIKLGMIYPDLEEVSE